MSMDEAWRMGAIPRFDASITEGFAVSSANLGEIES